MGIGERPEIASGGEWGNGISSEELSVRLVPLLVLAYSCKD
jgi:hypothetical protein